MNGCAAAIMVIWLLTDKNRLPIRPQTFAQSNIGKCSSFICGAPSTVMAPQTWMFAASISSFEKPSASSMLKLKSFSWSSLNPKVSLQNSSPRLNRLKANLMSNAFSSEPASWVKTASVKPFSLSAFGEMAWQLSRLP